MRLLRRRGVHVRRDCKERRQLSLEQSSRRDPKPCAGGNHLLPQGLSDEPMLFTRSKDRGLGRIKKDHDGRKEERRGKEEEGDAHPLLSFFLGGLA